MKLVTRSQAPRRDFFAEARASEPDPRRVCGASTQSRGRQKEVLAALKRLVNEYSVSPAKLIMDDDDQSVDMDELVFRPNLLQKVA